MRVFNVKVFDADIEGTTAVYASSDYDALLGSTDLVGLFVITSAVSGSSPTLTIQSEKSSDRIHWRITETPEIDGQALSSGSVETFDAPIENGPAFTRLKISLGGTTPKAHVVVWCTGRDHG